MKGRLVAFAATVLAILVLVTGTASAKGGWGFYFGDRDQFLIAGKSKTAEAIFPVRWQKLRASQPNFGYAVPASARWNGDAPLPKTSVRVGELDINPYLLRGRQMARAELRFMVPPTPGDYLLIACDSPCTTVASRLEATRFSVVANELEARVNRRLLEQSTEVDTLRYRVRQLGSRLRDVDEQQSNHFDFLGEHHRRMDDLEASLAQLERRPRGENDGLILMLAFLAGAAGALIANWLVHAAGVRFRRHGTSTVSQ
jgi:hypothetical protein